MANNEWGTGIAHSCGGEIKCRIMSLNARRVEYGFTCSGCDIKGWWHDLVKALGKQKVWKNKK